MSATMIKTVPWNVKGVGFDAREIAHRAARREGVPVGQWLNDVIRARADELGVSVDDFTQEERLDALVARLAGVAESVKAEEKSGVVRTPTSPHREVPSGTAGGQSMAQSWTDDDPFRVQGDARRASRADHAGGRDNLTRNPSFPYPPPESEPGARRWDDEILLDQAMELVERRTSEAQERAQGERQRMRIAALAKEVERLNRAEADATADRLRGRQRRADPPSPAASPARVDVAKDLDEQLRKLSARYIDRTGGDAARRGRTDGSADRAVPYNRAWPQPDDDGAQDLAPKRTRSARRDAIAEIAERQADLDAFEPRRAELLNSISHASMESARRGKEAEASAPKPRAAQPAATPATILGRGDPFDNLNEAFARLTERLETRLDEATKLRTQPIRQPDGEISALKTGIAALGTRLDAMKTQVERNHATTAERSGLDALRNEIAALQVGLAKLAPQSSIATLETAVRELGGQIDESRRDGVGDAVLQPIERLRAEVQKAVEAREIRGTLDRIEGQLESIAQRADMAGDSDPALAHLDELRTEAAEVRTLLQSAAGQFEAVGRLEGQIGQLGARLERLTELSPRAAVRDLELAANGIRTMLVELSPENALQDLSRKLDGLAERFGVIEEHIAAPTAIFDEFARRMEDAHAALAERLIKAAPVVDLAPIEDMIDGLSGKIDGLRYPVADMQALGGLIRGLAAQIEEARLPSAEGRILDGLESQVGRLAERLDRSDASLDAIASVERLVRDLFSQLDETRSATIDAAETAARTAAQQALRGAALPEATDEQGASRADRALEQVNLELSEFRKAQQVSEKRVHSTLLALNETLERMVDATLASARPGVSVQAADKTPEVAIADVRDDAAVVAPVAAPELAASPPVVAEQPAVADAKPVEIKRPVAPVVDIGRATTPADPVPDVSPLIAAARRAAQAAQTSAGEMSRKADMWDMSPKPKVGPKAESGWRAVFRQKRRPVLLSVASVVLLLGALEIARLNSPSRSNTVETSDAGGENTDTTAKSADAAPEAKSDGKVATATAPAPAGSGIASPTAVAPSSVAPAQQTASLATSSSSTAPDKGAPAGTTVVPADSALKALAPSLRSMAERGDAAAEAEVGARLADGRGLARDPKGATTWFQRSADQGYAPAEYRLGSAYEKGNGVAADPVQAVGWYEKAATQGNVRAMHNLAVMAAEGSAGKADYARAASWFTKAAEHGVRDSQYNLAILYARGLGLSQDLTQSYTWFSIAAAQGDQDAAKKRDDVAAKIDPDKIAAAKAAATAFKPLPVDKGANDITPPPGGWDIASPATGTSPTPKVSSM